MKSFILVSEYAKKHGISPQAIRSKIQRNRIKAKKINGKWHVEDDVTQAELDQQQENLTAYQAKQQAEAERIRIENSLKKQRLLNIRQDTELKKLKNSTIKEKHRVEYAQQVLTVFVQSFGQLKSYITALHLNKQQIEQFGDCIRRCTENFEKNLSQYLKEKDDEAVAEEEL